MWSIKGKNKGKKIPRPRAALDKKVLAGLRPAYDINAPTVLTTPLILASPHSGRYYPPEFLAQTALSEAQLRLGEDRYVDKIFAPLTRHGVPLLSARFARCYVDVNRSPDEWPLESLNGAGSITTPRTRAGLGVIPTRIMPEMDIYNKALSPKMIQNRLDALYHPYHLALKGLIAAAYQKFGTAILFDCHSMPGRDANQTKRPDFILGDRYGESCHPRTIVALTDILRTYGYSVGRNHPYAGGYVTAHYGRPNEGVEALQIEINKDLYLDPQMLEPHAGMAKLMADLENAIVQMMVLIRPAQNIAAQ